MVWFVPPLVSPNVPANVTAPDVAVFGVNPDNEVWNEVTGAVPLAAKVIRPCASTVMLALVYEPAVTAVLAKSMVTAAEPL